MKTMRKMIALLLAALFVFSPLAGVPFELPVFAATSGTTGACTWSLDGTVLTISGNGAMSNYSYGYTAPWSSSAITSVIIEEGVTSVGNYAFYYCPSLSSVTLPKSVATIGGFAFSGCTELADVAYGGGSSDREKVSIFYGNEKLESISWHGIYCDFHSFSGACDAFCNVCDYTRTPEIAHNFVDKVCKVCGLQEYL